MIFATPWLLLVLPALPLLWWLLRVTPPAPRTETFPAIRLLAGLRAKEETPARTPWWLLLLRMIVAALVIVGLAGPVLDAGQALTGSGPVLLVMDDDWSTAADWPARLRAANAVLDRAGRAGREVALLTTSRTDTDAPPAISPVMSVSDLRPRLSALRPKPWSPDRAAAAEALAHWDHKGGAVAYLADGIAAPDDARFASALRDAGAVTELRQDVPEARLLLPPKPDPGRLVARVSIIPRPAPTPVSVLAQTGDGRTLARADATIPPGGAGAELPVTLPLELRNQLARLVLDGPPSAGSVVLLDERWRRRPVGLLSSGLQNAEAPLIGALYYVRRALAPYAEVREGDLSTLLRRGLSVIVLPDEALGPGEEQERLAQWVEKGGLLIRFAGPRVAEASAGTTQGAASADTLLPVRLLAGDRQLGGAMSWSEPARLAPFPPDSPFHGLTPPAEVTVTRQVLAEPSANLSNSTWARLTDGTPLVTEAARGAGRIVLFHTTANADWSNLPLSGLFVDMLRRLVMLSAGIATTPDATVLNPAEILDGFGQVADPPPAATGLPANQFATTPVSPRHPPGLYGPENGREALNLANNLPALAAAQPVASARQETLAAAARERALGPWLLAAALALMALDLLISLRLRGLLRFARASAGAAAMVLLLILPAHAQPPGQGSISPDFPALATHLAYVVTGDPSVDRVSQEGLAGLSDFVNQRTAASLADPVAVHPGKDDLSFYPLLYWPITASTPASDPAMIAALNDFMNHGGIILIDTQGGDTGSTGSGAGMADGVSDALKRATQGLTVPPLTPLSTDHVLARAFYLLREYPGRYQGAPVWVQRGQDRANDSVSPVILGANDWAAAWAVDADGRHPYAAIPGGDRQRLLAYRFGVNVVMYALTGNYKGDQVHVPAILERLGQ